MIASPTGMLEMPTTLVEMVQQQAEALPNIRAFTFLEDGETRENHLSYGELDRRARTIAAFLRSMVGAGERVLLLYPAGLDFLAAFLGCLYAGCIAVPTFPPNPFRLQRTLPRMLAIIKDSRPAVVLTIKPIVDMSRQLQGQYELLGELRWVAVEDMPTSGARGWHPPQIGDETVAFLQYTSGSTANPKGVILTHNNLLHNLSLIRQALGFTKNSRLFSWLPFYHDMGLIGGILTPLFSGIPAILMSPLHFLQRPVRWLRAISDYGITHSGGPNFSFEVCARKVALESVAQLDLSSWEVAWNGAEPVRVGTMERFVEKFASCGFRRETFYPCYGLAEATLIVSGGNKAERPVVAHLEPDELAAGRIVPIDCDEAIALPGCGKTLDDQLIRIVDPQTSIQCGEERVGEIWVKGRSVAGGYWNLAEESERVFQAYTADTGEGPFLRTGDLGLLMDGELFVTGRLKDLIIVDGLNHYPQDIELTVEQSHPALRPGCSAAFSVDVENQERVVVIVEVARPERLERLKQKGKDLKLQAIQRAIQRSVSDRHDLRLHDIMLLDPGTIPKTMSGKIQRHVCREEYLSNSLSVWTD